MERQRPGTLRGRCGLSRESVAVQRGRVYGVQFWNVNDLMGISVRDFRRRVRRSNRHGRLYSTTKFPEAARLRIAASGNTYSGYVNGKLIVQGAVSTSTVPTTAHYVGVMIQDASAVSGGGQPPACLVDFAAYTY